MTDAALFITGSGNNDIVPGNKRFVQAFDSRRLVSVVVGEKNT
jgi:hypothetical protein